MARSYQRGHKIIYYQGSWVYADTKESISTERPCIRCGQMPTKEGHDHCLRFFKKAASACCGHGVEKPYAILKQERV